MKHRKLTAVLAATALVTPAFAKDMTVVSWGGAYQSSQEKAYAKPYLEANPDLNIVWDSSSGEAVAKMRAMSEAGNVTWDIVDVEGPDAVRLCDEGIAMEIDFDEMLADGEDGSTATEDFGDTLVGDCFIPQIVFSTTFGYRSDVEAWGGKKPTELCDVFDLEGFPGKRSLNKGPKKNLEWALICDGVAKDDLYDVLDEDGGIERALAKLDTIKDNVIWWTAGAETPQLLADGEVVMGSTYNGRLFSVIVEQEQPVEMLWDYQVFDFDGWIIPADLPEDRLKAALDFAKYTTDTQRLADLTKFIAYGPARASSQPLVSTHKETGVEMAPHMPTNPENAKRYIVNNLDWWADNQDDAEAKFQAWLAK